MIISSYEQRFLESIVATSGLDLFKGGTFSILGTCEFVLIRKPGEGRYPDHFFLFFLTLDLSTKASDAVDGSVSLQYF